MTQFSVVSVLLISCIENGFVCAIHEHHGQLGMQKCKGCI